MSYVVGQTRRTRLVAENSGHVVDSDLSRVVPALPPVMAWRAGTEVAGLSLGKLPAGTVIAAFDQAGKSKASEMAIYLGHDARGIHALIPGGASGRWAVTTLSFQQPRDVRRALNGNAYRVVEYR